MNTMTFNQFTAIAGNQAAIALYRLTHYHQIVETIINRAENTDTDADAARIEEDENLNFWTTRLAEERGRFHSAPELAQAVFEATTDRDSAYTVGANAVQRRAESLMILMQGLATDPEDMSDATVTQLRDAAVVEYEKPDPHADVF